MTHPELSTIADDLRIRITQLENEVQQLRALGGGDVSEGTFTHVYSDTAEFGELPAEVARIGTNVNQTITTASEFILLAPSDKITNTGRGISDGIIVDTTLATIDMRPFKGSNIFMMGGYASVLGSTSARNVALSLFTAGTENEVVRLYDSPSDNGIFAINWNFMNRIAGGAPDILEMRIFHTGSSDMVVSSWRFWVYRLK